MSGIVRFAETFNPEVETDFTVLGQANEVAGWKHYTHIATPKTDSSKEIWVVVGTTVLGETRNDLYLDEINILIV